MRQAEGTDGKTIRSGRQLDHGECKRHPDRGVSSTAKEGRRRRC